MARTPVADFRDTRLPIRDRVEALVAALSRDETIALAGLDAIYVVGGSAGVALPAEGPVTPLAGITARAGDGIVVRQAQGSWGDVGLSPVPAALLRLPGTDEPGVQVEFADATAPGTPVRIVQVGLDQLSAPSGFSPNWTARLRTCLQAPATGRYRLSLLVSGVARMAIDGVPVMSGEREAHRFLAGPAYPLQCVVRLEAGAAAEISIDYQTGSALQTPDLGLMPGLQLGWQPPDALIQDAAAAAASDVAIVLVQQASGEGMDRVSLELPGAAPKARYRSGWRPGTSPSSMTERPGGSSTRESTGFTSVSPATTCPSPWTCR